MSPVFPKIIFVNNFGIKLLNQNFLTLVCIQMVIIQLLQLVLDIIALFQSLQTSLIQSIAVTIFSDTVDGENWYQNTHIVLL